MIGGGGRDRQKSEMSGPRDKDAFFKAKAKLGAPPAAAAEGKKKRPARIVWNEENLENNQRMKEEEGYASMKIDEVQRPLSAPGDDWAPLAGGHTVQCRVQH